MHGEAAAGPGGGRTGAPERETSGAHGSGVERSVLGTRGKLSLPLYTSPSAPRAAAAARASESGQPTRPRCGGAWRRAEPIAQRALLSCWQRRVAKHLRVFSRCSRRPRAVSVAPPRLHLLRGRPPRPPRPRRPRPPCRPPPPPRLPRPSPSKQPPQPRSSSSSSAAASRARAATECARRALQTSRPRPRTRRASRAALGAAAAPPTVAALALLRELPRAARRPSSR